MLIDEFDYNLPKELIAQDPCFPRDECRMMVLNGDRIEHRIFKEIVDYLSPGDILVLNDTKVVRARFHGRKSTGGKIELLLLGMKNGLFNCLVKGKVREGTEIIVNKFEGKIVEKEGGKCLIDFPCSEEELEKVGEMPLPPYIKKELSHPEMYQTIYASKKGAVAAPTAGLHFTHSLLKEIEGMGAKIAFITLHVGIGTFLPIREKNVENHRMEGEYYKVGKNAADMINDAIDDGNRIIAVGTTSAKTLETVGKNGHVDPRNGWSDLFIYPGYEFKIIGGLLTNFHLPKSTNLLLVCAYAEREKIMKAYRMAIEKKYRFYSFGDAMLCLK
jgi:S-adenosylmethionine:tRNA ribosyltransferase-isomerase